MTLLIPHDGNFGKLHGNYPGKGGHNPRKSLLPKGLSSSAEFARRARPTVTDCDEEVALSVKYAQDLACAWGEKGTRLQNLVGTARHQKKQLGQARPWAKSLPSRS
mmetsp:Transcript_29817/g.79281  ORF Transcript_29817/g.79281 Transcript_29817/m.79281 type:complete len:106 (-) Transcript_29817:2122-2439(-)